MLYVDCFAGKGKFDDGKDGSPLVALDCLDTSLRQTRESKIGAPDPQVFMRFIELYHAEALKANLPLEHVSRSKVISGAFESEIIKLLTAAIQKYRDLNAFLYVDPYGIKALSMPLFLRLPEVFSSAELLINLNS